MRYEHFLHTTKRGPMPSAVVCVEVDTRFFQRGSTSRTRLPTLRSWHAVSCTQPTTDPSDIKCCYGLRSDPFWTLLERLTRRRDNIWIFTSFAPATWSLLGLFERLETGQLQFFWPKSQRKTRCLADRHQLPSAVIVLEEPTNALITRLPGSAAVITWVDLRNYGVRIDQDDAPAGQRVQRSYNFVSGMIVGIDVADWGGLKVTAASQTYHTFRYKHLQHAALCHTHSGALQLERESYYGGRCECFRIGVIKEKVWLVDAMSLYGYVCATESLPVRLKRYEEWPTGVEQLSLRDEPPDMADVQIETPRPLYPFRRGELTVWPVGSFRTCLTGPELAFAWSLGHVHRIYRAAWYERERLTASWANHLLVLLGNMRRQNMVDLAHWIKALLVCLPGKLGASGISWQDAPEQPWLHPWDQWRAVDGQGYDTRIRVIAGIAQKQIRAGWGDNAIPSAAAWITSAARWRLLEAIGYAGEGNTYYCDTDSLLVNEAGYARLCTGGFVANDQPGLFKVEFTADHAEINGWKCYRAADKVVCSGLPRSATPAHAGGYYCWFTGWIADACHKHKRPDAAQKLLRRVSNRTYKHGVLQDDGSVRPFQLPTELNLIHRR